MAWRSTSERAVKFDFHTGQPEPHLEGAGPLPRRRLLAADRRLRGPRLAAAERARERAVLLRRVLGLCCESKFMYRTLDGRDVSRVRKLVPTNCSLFLPEDTVRHGRRSAQTTAALRDKYKLEFYEGSTNEEKANTIGLALLMD